MNRENTTICNISFFAMASTIDAGKTWLTKSFRLSALACTSACAVSGGSGRPRPTPGRNRWTIASPSSSETTEAPRNQRIVRAPMRPNWAPTPILAIPAISVENTSGAMIILINCRNAKVTIFRLSAIALAWSATR